MFKYFMIMALFVASTVAKGQWKSYRLINNDRDTINCIDEKDMKQGRWVIRVESLRGEPGYESEGIFKDGKKEGIWRSYTTMGDLFAIERFRWGNKDGKCQYYAISGIEREESWKAVNPDNPYDTVDVMDPVDPTKVTQAIVKIEGTSVKHGIWKFYESSSGMVIKTESYFLGKLDVPKPAKAIRDDNSIALIDTSKTTTPKKVKPKEVMDFEKKTGRKKAKVADGSTGL